MKAIILKSILATILLITSITSCTDDDVPVPAPIVEAASLAYAEGGASLAYVTNPFANASTKTIFGNNASTNIVEIKLSSLAVGTYTISSENRFKYTRVGTTSPWNAVLGTITINSNTDNKVSGYYDLTAGDSDLGINSVSGKFINVVINP